MAASEIIALDQTIDDPPVSQPSQSDPETMEIADSAFLSQIDRISRSEELRGSEILRQLLKFLAEKTVSGEADELKEYIVAIDGLGKPTTYDPRYNSAVRLQMGRLRQKLANYYLKEGQCDQILIDVPKGRFKLKGESRECSIDAVLQSTPEPTAPAVPAEKLGVPRFKRLREDMRTAAWVVAGIAAGIMITVVVGMLLHRIQPAKTNASSISYPAGWDASVEELWRPFIASSQSIVVVINDPLFVEIGEKKGIYYRDSAFNSWDEVVSSPKTKAIRDQAKGSVMEPVRYFTAYQEAAASFMIAKLLGSRVPNLSIVKATDLSMQEVADNNVVFVGDQGKYFNQQIEAAPIESPMQPVPEGIRNLHPGAKEPELFADQYSTAPTEEGFAYALVTHLPGPLGRNDVESFASSRGAAYLAAVKAFTDPGFIRPLVVQLKQAGGGQMPRYYQVLLKVKFKADVPTEITYVLSRELHYEKKQ